MPSPWFHRGVPSSDDGRPPPPEPVVVDPVLSFLGASQADRVRMLVHRSAVEGGVEMVVHPGIAVDAWG